MPFRNRSIGETLIRFWPIMLMGVAWLCLPRHGFAADTPPGSAISCKVTSRNLNCTLTKNIEPVNILEVTSQNGQVMITNATGLGLVLSSVSATTSASQWGEFCVFLDEYFTGQQHEAGKGEIGCATKNPGANYGQVSWGPGLGVQIPPKSSIYIGSHVLSEHPPHSFELTLSNRDRPVISYRFPHVDKSFKCMGKKQSYALEPWVNTSGKIQKVLSTLTYAVSGSETTPNRLAGAGCIYVLSREGSVKSQYCSTNLISENAHVPLDLDLLPGEAVAAQANNTCEPPARWGWVVYLAVAADRD